MHLSRTALTFALTALLLPHVAAAQATTDLQELIDKAPAGGEVTVPQGTWSTPLRITKPIKLRGENRDACVLDVVSDEPAIRFAHGKGGALVENLTVRWQRETSNPATDVQAALAMKDGAVRLRNLRVVAPGSNARCPSAFTASGFGDAKIEACEFEGFEFTLQFGDGATGRITDCVVAKPGHCGITAGPESTVHVSRTIVTGSGYHGLRCTGGQMNADNSVVVANKNRGIYLGNKSARGTIRDNVILNNGTGISAFAQSEVKIQNNLIAGSDFAAIDMRDGCRLAIQQNLLANNGRAVVLFKETGKNRNTIGRNGSAGNKTETEGFEKAPELQKVEGALADGELSMDAAKGLGLTDPTRVKPVWERWTALRDGATTQPAADKPPQGEAKGSPRDPNAVAGR